MKKITSISIGESLLNMEEYATKSEIQYPKVSGNLYKYLPLTLVESESTSARAVFVTPPLEKDSMIHVCFRIPNYTGNGNNSFMITKRKSNGAHDRVLAYIPVNSETYFTDNLLIKKGTIIGINTPIAKNKTVDDIRFNNNIDNLAADDQVLQVSVFDEV